MPILDPMSDRRKDRTCSFCAKACIHWLLGAVCQLSVKAFFERHCGLGPTIAMVSEYAILHVLSHTRPRAGSWRLLGLIEGETALMRVRA